MRDPPTRERGFAGGFGLVGKKQSTNRKLCKADRRERQQDSTMKTKPPAIRPNGASSSERPRVHNATCRRRVRMKDHIFTLGIEEEFQIIDPETRELRSHIQQILADVKLVLKEHVQAEMHQSVVELGT